MTIKLYLIVMFAVPLLDAFDRLFARTAFRMDAQNGCALWPDRLISWGIVSNVRVNPGLPLHDLRFFRMKVPLLRTWGITGRPWTDPYGPSYGFREHWLYWIEGRMYGGEFAKFAGWHLEPRLPQ